MKESVFIGKFVKDGEEVFEGVLFAAFNGVLTGIKKHGFSISLNTRKPSDVSNYLNLGSNILNMIKGKHSVPKLIRDTLEECSEYSCAFEKLKNTELTAPAYFTIAGMHNNEGAVISRDPTSIANLRTLDDNWYVIQTNEDIFEGKCTARC